MARNSSGSLLVVDDDRHIQNAMADYLRSLGHRTETASTCLEALERMEEFPFEVVICDVNLPDKDGFHLLQWAREHAPETAVILLTGFGTIESAVEAIRMFGVSRGFVLAGWRLLRCNPWSRGGVDHP